MKRKLVKSGLKIGDLVKMVNCSEAGKYPDKVWSVRSEPWEVCGSEVVLLEGKSGGFDTSFLHKIESEVNSHGKSKIYS